MMRMRLWCGLVVAVVSGSAVSAVAEPYLAVRSGYSCNSCHVNITGGGMRTNLIAAHAREILHYPDWFDALTKPIEAFDGDLNDYVSIGATLRGQGALIFQDNPNSNGEVDNNEVFRTHLDEIDVDVEEAVGYLNGRLIPDLLEFYVDMRFAPTTDAREVWGLIYLPMDFYLKGGRMFLPYGLQIQDDDSFIRGGNNGSASTGFTFNQRAEGLEIGWIPEPWSVVLAVSDGAGKRDVQVTGTASGLFKGVEIFGFSPVNNALLGVSGTRNGGSEETYEIGLFGGFNIGPITYLGEVDFVQRRVVSASDPSGGKSYHGGFIHYSEVNYLLLDWLNVKVAFDYADYDGDLSDRGDDSENRVSIGLEPFLARFLQTRLFYRIGNGVESAPDHNQNILSLEMHVFF
jgi:hypothetical protein